MECVTDALSYQVLRAANPTWWVRVVPLAIQQNAHFVCSKHARLREHCLYGKYPDAVYIGPAPDGALCQVCTLTIAYDTHWNNEEKRKAEHDARLKAHAEALKTRFP